MVYLDLIGEWVMNEWILHLEGREKGGRMLRVESVYMLSVNVCLHSAQNEYKCIYAIYQYLITDTETQSYIV